jgi:nucleoporin NUP1
MQDDKDRLGKKVSGSGKSPVVNETKPYAGEGGMKKLLARRKLEVEEAGEEEGKSKDASPPVVGDAAPAPDWFSTVASGAGARSLNLRVGRSQSSRSHSRPYKAKFSAKFDEEPDDALDKPELRRLREREMLKEAAKKAPPVELPVDFSFAKDVGAFLILIFYLC